MTDEPEAPTADDAAPEIHPDYEVEHRPDSDPDEILPVRQALARVMGSIQVIRKDQTFDSRRQGQSGGTTYKFRGVDDVVNAVGPMLRRHGVLVMPHAEEIQTAEISTSGGGKRLHVIVKMGYHLRGLVAGDEEVLIGSAYGESADSGDKAVAKAESVAYRVFWLQALCIPTDDVDPDSENFERGDDRAQQQSSSSGRRSSGSGSRRSRSASQPQSDLVSDSQAEQIRKAIEKLPEGEHRNESLAAFKAEFKVNRANEVKRSDFTKAMRFLHEQLVGPAAAAASDPPPGDDPPPDDDDHDEDSAEGSDGPTFSEVHEQLVAFMEAEKIDRRFVQTTLAKLGLPATGTTDELMNGLAAAWSRMGGIPDGAIS